jgi:hypothetical protein
MPAERNDSSLWEHYFLASSMQGWPVALRTIVL